MQEGKEGSVEGELGRSEKRATSRLSAGRRGRKGGEEGEDVKEEGGWRRNHEVGGICRM